MLLHIGYHKTGTTWLQKQYFPRHPSLATPFSGDEIRQQIVYPNPLCFDLDKAKSHFANKISELEESGKVAVLSTERLCGSPFAGGYDSREISKRLHSVFPNAKIWIVIRNQTEIIASTYRNYIEADGSANLERFLKGQSPERFPFFALSHFEYHRLIEQYQALFGKDNVLISLYEDFRDNPKHFFDNLDSHIEVQTELDQYPITKKVYRGRSDLTILLRRYLSGLQYNESMLDFPVFGFSKGKMLNRAMGGLDKLLLRHISINTIQRRIDKHLGNFFYDSNHKLSKIVNRDLSEKNYKTAP